MKFNRILASVLAVAIIGASMPAVSVNMPKISLTANAAESEHPLKYETLADGTIEIKKCDRTVTEVEIPAEIDGKTVTSIGERAFDSCESLTSVTIPDSVKNIGEGAFVSSGLTEITIPNSVTSIGRFAFSNCLELTSINISESVTSIGGRAFYKTPWLKNKQKENPLVIVNDILIDGTTCSGDVVIPDSFTSIGDYAFYDCSKLTSITIPDSVTSIGCYAFAYCSGLTSVTIPDSVTSISGYALAYCSGLTSVTIPDSVTNIGGRAFYKTPWLENKQKENPWVIVNDILIDGTTCSGDVTIPNSITSIGDSAFISCFDITSITIPDSVTSIGDSAFNSCSGLTSITIPDSVTSISNGAFSWCTGLTSINIPDSVTSISNGAFSWCTGLTSINIPDSVTSIGEEAFENCSNLTSITIPDSVTHIGVLAFGFSGLTSITIPDKVTSIGYMAFCGCSGLTEITIPDSVTSIDHHTFYECSSLTEITIPNSVTSIGNDTFGNCSSLILITILNPDCEIYDNEYTISNDYDNDKHDYYFNGTIRGYENSTAQAYAEKYNRKFESLGKAPESKVIAGDANCDGKVSIADATAILQHLGNQDKYGLSAEGLKNADVDENDGVSTNDALVIQKVDANLLTVEQLPLKK